MDIFKAEKGVYELMYEVLKRHHAGRLVDIMDQIQIVFRETASVVGGKVIQGKTRRANSILEVLHGDKSMFIIELAADVWQSFDDKQKYALLDHHLCAIHVSENKQGDRTYKVGPPDFEGFRGEIERHGVWRFPVVPDDENPVDEEDLIDSLFGPSSRMAQGQ